MSTNRKLPFGYARQMGKVCIQDQEAELVKVIFRDYVNDLSYIQITEKLNSQPVPYNRPDVRWNKNMVARILEDRRYTGEKEFPQIIAPELLAAALLTRADKQTAQPPSEIKTTLRRLSGHKATAQMVQDVLAILNDLIRSPGQVQEPMCMDRTAEKESQLQQELQDAIYQQSMDETAAKSLAYDLAAARLNNIGSGDYETMRIKAVLAQAQESAALDPRLLKSIASAVLVCPDRTINLLLKNGQIIERRRTP